MISSTAMKKDGPLTVSSIDVLYEWGYSQQTSARVSLLRVEIENETSQGIFWDSRMRMRVLMEKLRVENENESSEGKNEIEIENGTLNFQE